MASDPVLAEQHHYKRHMPSVAAVVTYWREHPQPWVNYRDGERRGLSLPGGNGGRLTSSPSTFMTLAGWRNIIGVVDSTPPKSDLVQLGFNETLIPEPLNVHRGHTIIIRPVATVRALVFVQPLIPVRFAYRAAFRAGLTCITRVNHNDGMPGFLSLVFNHLAQLGKRPTDLHITVLYADFFGCVTNTFKVFQREKRGL